MPGSLQLYAGLPAHLCSTKLSSTQGSLWRPCVPRHRRCGHSSSSRRTVAAAGATDNKEPSTSDAPTSTTSSSSSSNESPANCTITYRGQVLEVAQGSKLRTALLLGGLSPHNGRAQLINCRGLGTCGTCAVEVRGEVLPASWTAAEQLRLNFPPHSPPNNTRLRLACQVSCVGGQLEVIKRDRFWGQGDVVLGPAAPGDYSLPLGELEFLLDSSYSKAASSGSNGSSNGSTEHDMH